MSDADAEGGATSRASARRFDIVVSLNRGRLLAGFTQCRVSAAIIMLTNVTRVRARARAFILPDGAPRRMAGWLGWAGLARLRKFAQGEGGKDAGKGCGCNFPFLLFFSPIPADNHNWVRECARVCRSAI